MNWSRVCGAPGGGYRLSRDHGEIFVAEIIDAVNEQVDATGCGGKEHCQGGEVCLTHHLWEDLSKEIHGFLSQISLASLMEKREVKNISARQDARRGRGRDPGTQ